MVVNISQSALMKSASSTRIAVCSWSLRPDSPASLLERLHRLELSAAQLALSPIIHDPRLWGAAIDELRAGGTWIVSGMMAMEGENYATLESIARTGGVRPDHTWYSNRSHAEQVALLASRTGIGLVTFHAGFIAEDPGSPERAKMVDRLRVICEIFAHYGVDLALETGQETAGSLVSVLEQLDCTNIGVNFDPANIVLYDKGDPIEAFRQLKPWVRQVHIKDAKPTRIPGQWGREVPVGKGVVNWDRFFDIALSITPPVAFVIERESRSAKDEDIVQARDLIAYHLRPKRDSDSAHDEHDDHHD
jgi:L-ribulose-5-phosphate 3-epimerase